MSITGGVRRVLGRVRKRFVRGGVVLAYHRVAELAHDPFNLAVSPDNFVRQMEYLKDTCILMHLNELGEALRAGHLPSRAVAITFDDGYVDLFVNAYPVLNRAAIPATIFMPTGFMESGREFWWDELARNIFHNDNLPARLSLSIRGESHQWETMVPDEQSAAFWSVYRLIKGLDHELRQQVLDELSQHTGIDVACRPGYRTLNRDELARMTGDGLIMVGGHTVTHASLSSLGENEQRQEIIKGRGMLESWLGQPVTTFAYPYGDYNRQTVSLLKRAEFSLACTTIRGRVEPGDNPFTLNRCEVNDWPADHFASQMESFFLS